MHPAVLNGSYDVARVREDFPALTLKVYGKPLVYLDNAASAQKPNAVLERMTEAYKSEYANVHRGLHYLANAATEAYEGGRAKVAKFLNAGRNEEIVFTRNATEAINLVASSWGEPNIGDGDEIVLSIMEHHSNIVPWHFLRERHGAVIKWADVDDEGNFLIDEFEKLLTDRTKLVAITQMSNALGTIVPVKDVVKLAHARGIPVLVDGSQAAVHLARRRDVADLELAGDDRPVTEHPAEQRLLHLDCADPRQPDRGRTAVEDSVDDKQLLARDDHRRALPPPHCRDREQRREYGQPSAARRGRPAERQQHQRDGEQREATSERTREHDPVPAS